MLTCALLTYHCDRLLFILFSSVLSDAKQIISDARQKKMNYKSKKPPNAAAAAEEAAAAAAARTSNK